MKISVFEKFYKFMLLQAIVIAFISIFCFKVQDTSLMQKETEPFNSGWYYIKNNEKVYIDTDEYKPSLSKGDSITIYKDITTILPYNYCMSFRTNDLNISVSVDDEEIYYYGRDNAIWFGHTSGSGWHIIPLLSSYYGHTISITITCLYDYESQFLLNIIGGSHLSCIYNIISGNIFGLITCFFLICSGLVIIIIYCLFNKKFNINKSLLFLGLTAIFIGIWSTLETKTLQLVSGNLVAMSNLTFLSLMLVPISVVFYFRYQQPDHFIGFSDVCIYICITNFTISNLLHVLGVADYANMIFVTHISLVFCSIYIILLSINGFKQIIKERNTKSFISATILCACVAIDILRYRLGNYVDNSKYIRIGLLVYVLFLAYSMITRSITIVKRSEEADMYEKMALVDALTGIANRSSYLEKLSEIKNKAIISPNTAIIIFDVNNLKYVNDNLGHTYGDHLIKDAALTISEAFATYGTAYRTGGDEFAVLSDNCTETDFENGLAVLRELEREKNKKNSDYTLSIAVGFAAYNMIVDHSFSDTIDRADKAMYIDKSKIKKLS